MSGQHRLPNQQIAELGGRLRGLQSSLQYNVMREFELLGMGEEAPNMLLLERLRSCCMVVNALGSKVPQNTTTHTHTVDCTAWLTMCVNVYLLT